MSSRRESRRRLVFNDEVDSEKKANDVDSLQEKTLLDIHRSTLNTVSSPKSKRKAVALITPIKRSREEDAQHKNLDYIPKHLYKAIGYSRRGEKKINKIVKATFSLIDENFFIPDDFETNDKYGPKSGSYFEEHAIRAYSQGMLLSKSEKMVEICTGCGTLGHTRDDCPSLT
jgi:hypothetical protein